MTKSINLNINFLFLDCSIKGNRAQLADIVLIANHVPNPVVIIVFIFQ